MSILISTLWSPKDTYLAFEYLHIAADKTSIQILAWDTRELTQSNSEYWSKAAGEIG